MAPAGRNACNAATELALGLLSVTHIEGGDPGIFPLKFIMCIGLLSVTHIEGPLKFIICGVLYVHVYTCMHH